MYVVLNIRLCSSFVFFIKVFSYFRMSSLQFVWNIKVPISIINVSRLSKSHLQDRSNLGMVTCLFIVGWADVVSVDFIAGI